MDDDDDHNDEMTTTTNNRSIDDQDDTTIPQQNNETPILQQYADGTKMETGEQSSSVWMTMDMTTTSTTTTLPDTTTTTITTTKPSASTKVMEHPLQQQQQTTTTTTRTDHHRSISSNSSNSSQQQQEQQQQEEELTTTTTAKMMMHHPLAHNQSRSSKTSLLSPPQQSFPPPTTASSSFHHHHHMSYMYSSTSTNTSSNSSSSSSSILDHHDNDDDYDYNDYDYNTQPHRTRTQRHTTRPTTTRRRCWTVTLFSMTTVLLFADQNLLSPNLTQIAIEFGLTDQERDRMLGGDISLAFFLVGAPASFLVGYLADTHNRATVFATTVIVGELACFFTYFVTTYRQLYICRAITGFSVGGALPVIYSILGDLFGAEDRHVVSAVVSAGLGAGISVGQAIAGYIGPTYGWRIPFLIVSIPAICCAILVYCTVEDPPRGAMERAVLSSQEHQQHQRQQQYEQPPPLPQQNHFHHHPSGNGSGSEKYYDDMNPSSQSLPDGVFRDNPPPLHESSPPPSSSPSLPPADNNINGIKLAVDDDDDDNNNNNDRQQPQQQQQYLIVNNGNHHHHNNRNGTTTTTTTTNTTDYYLDDIWTDHFYHSIGSVVGSWCCCCSWCGGGWCRNRNGRGRNWEWTTTSTSMKHYYDTTIELLSTPTVVLSLLQGAPGCVPWGIINVFLNDYLSEDRGFTVEMATTTLMVFSLGYSIGLIVGGVGGRILYQIDIRYPSILAGVTAIMGCFPLWYLFNHVDSNTPYYVSATSAMIAGLGSAPTGPIIKATLTNVTLPTARGQAFALFNLFDDFGKGLGPFFVSLLIVTMGGRRPAFNVGVLGWVICGIANLAIFFTVSRDELKVQSQLVAAATQQQFQPVSTIIPQE